MTRWNTVVIGGLTATLAAIVSSTPPTTLAAGQSDERLLVGHLRKGKQLFEEETFNGNGRTCLTCHSRETGTVSPEAAQRRFAKDPDDPLFRADGSDDGIGHGVSRMLTDATILVRVPLAANVTVRNDPSARTVTLRRGIPSTLNTPALDPVLMLDGRQPNLRAQARAAIVDHAQPGREPSDRELARLEEFERTPGFFSSPAMLALAYFGVTPRLPAGQTAAERRGRRFFEDLPPGPDRKDGLCSSCHSGPMLDQTNEFLPAPPFRQGGRFQSIAVSELNQAGNPVFDFIFKNADGTTLTVSSPDPGRALITGNGADPESLNAFKIPSLWGIRRTAPYFHDNSAKTLEDVLRHYALFFQIVTQGALVLSEQDQADAVAYLKLLK